MMYRVEWKQRLQPTDEHRTIFETMPMSKDEAERIEREMQGNPAYSDVKILEQEEQEQK